MNSSKVDRLSHSGDEYIVGREEELDEEQIVVESAYSLSIGNNSMAYNPFPAVNFVACQLCALLAAFWFRLYLKPSQANSSVRHAFATILGIYFALFCFGWYSIHIFTLVMISYFIMNMASISNIHRTRPSLLEYLSYQLNFMSIIAGPCSNFKDYIDFIEGRHVQMKLLKSGWKQRSCDSFPDPSPVGAILQKLAITLLSMVVFLTLTKTFPATYIVDDQFMNQSSFLTRLGFLYVVMQASKPKYYFAWTLGKIRFKMYDTVINSDIIACNLHIYTFSFSNFLLSVCYDRTSWYPTALTFLLSALWHGVYPGYYFTFTTGIFMTLAARRVRNNCRPVFISSKLLKVGYDMVTWFATQLSVCYTVAPFVLLAVEPTIKLYKSLYFHMHILCILVLLVLPNKSQKLSRGNQAIGMEAHSCNKIKKQK
ncbi:PREDICTED: lysophospholipid acyltransferase 1-like [Thamnophis sirtalis]|uniref:Lysophospholipid acyltransferase 1-like n=1 Tax=Thamnophis sirtalis TaxID=35019 RepID=A0A6I9YCE9_9SAUR|nr:PREDICTED: lysophospholipid acyltransferase 1-like [Thamnophis sirtalis]